MKQYQVWALLVGVLAIAGILAYTNFSKTKSAKIGIDPELIELK